MPYESTSIPIPILPEAPAYLQIASNLLSPPHGKPSYLHPLLIEHLGLVNRLQAEYHSRLESTLMIAREIDRWKRLFPELPAYVEAL